MQGCLTFDTIYMFDRKKIKTEVTFRLLLLGFAAIRILRFRNSGRTFKQSIFTVTSSAVQT